MKTLEDYISEALLRWNAPMPRFFKPLYQASLVLMILCGGLVFAQSTLASYGLHVPGWLTIASGVAGTVGTLITKLTLDRDRLSLGQKRELSRLQTPWWLAGLFFLNGYASWVGWVVFSVIISWLLFIPAFKLSNRLMRKSIDRTNKRNGYEPEAFKDARRMEQAQATIRETKALQLFGNKLREKGSTNADDIDEIRGVLTGATA